MKRMTILFVCLCVLLCGCAQATPVQTESSHQNTVQTTEQAPAETTTPRETVYVAVIDTGFSPESIPEESTIAGKNYLDESLTTVDTFGHGTAVAGIILDHAPDAKLVPLVSNVYDGGKIAQVDNDVFAQMIRDAVDVYDCAIINISAGLVLDKERVREAIAYAEEKDVLVVASVGNDYDINGTVAYYPAAYESVLAVGALDAAGKQIAAFSQRGEWVDLYAIGQEVVIRTLSGNSRSSDGTSYAAAKTTAAAVRLLEQEPGLTAAQLRDRLLEEACKMEDSLRILVEH